MQQQRPSTAKKQTKKAEWRHSSELLLLPAQPECIIRPLIYLYHVIGLAKNFIQVFPEDLMETSKWAFWVTQCNYSSAFCFLCFYMQLLIFCISFIFHTYIASFSHLFTHSSCVNLLAAHSSTDCAFIHFLLPLFIYVPNFLLRQPATCSFFLALLGWFIHLLTYGCALLFITSFFHLSISPWFNHLFNGSCGCPPLYSFIIW